MTTRDTETYGNNQLKKMFFYIQNLFIIHKRKKDEGI